MDKALNAGNACEFDKQLRPIAKAIACGDAVLFPCNGLSISVGAPCWDHVVEILKSELDPPTRETDHGLIAQFYRNQYGDHAFFRRLREIIFEKELHPGVAHACLANLPISIVLTTNYDSLLERAFIDAGKKTHVIRDDAELALWERSDVQIIKVHGDLNAASTIVFSHEDGHRFLAENVMMRAKLVELLRFHTVVFIGCSMRDSDIDFILHEAHEGSGRLSRPAYNLTFDDDPHLHKEWRRKGIEPIVIPKSGDEEKGAALGRVLARLNRLVQVIKGECDILLVDDDKDVRKAQVEFLRARFPKASIEVAKNGFEAAHKIGELRPSVVIVDVCLAGPASLDGYNGFEFVQSVRNDPRLSETQFIMISSFLDLCDVPGIEITIQDMAELLDLPFFRRNQAALHIYPLIQQCLDRRIAA